MKRLILTLALLLPLLGLRAEDDRGLGANQRTVGHSSTDRIDVSDACFGQEGTYTIGALLDAETLAPYRNCKVVGLRVASGLDLGRTRTFLSTAADNKTAPLHVQNQRLYEGWNNIFFNGEGFDVPEGQGLFFGFDYTETPSMAASEQGALCGVGDDTPGGFMWEDQGSLYEVSGIGSLCVQLIMDVSNLPAHDAAITFFDTGFRYKPWGESVEIYSMVTNTGREPLSKVRMGIEFGDAPAKYVDAELNLQPGAAEIWSHIAEMPAGTEPGACRLRVFVDEIDGTKADPSMAGNSRQAEFAYYRNILPRRGAFVEVYADNQNIMSAMLDEVTADFKATSKLDYCLAKHLEGESPLRLEESAWLFDRYAYTRPCFTVNRSHFPGEAHTAYDVNDYFGVLPTDFLSGLLADIVAQDAGEPSFGEVDLTTSFDPLTRELTVRADGLLVQEAPAMFGSLSLTLLLVEDQVTAPQAVWTGKIPKWDAGYRHDDVVRGYITEPRGDEVQVADGTFLMVRSVTLPEGWKEQDMRVIALLTKTDVGEGANPDLLDVVNCNWAEVTDGSGVGSMVASPSGEESWYSLQGLRLQGKPRAGEPAILVRPGERPVKRLGRL